MADQQTQTREFHYRNAQGHIAYTVTRPRGKKTFFVTNATGEKGYNDTPRVLYHLPELNDLDNFNRQIFFVEGESDAETLQAIGLLATTSPGGANAWNKGNYAETLRSRNVTILPDNDPPGKRYARQVRDSLLLVDASVKIVELPGLSEKQDVTNWLASDGSKEELLMLVKRAPLESLDDDEDLPVEILLQPLSEVEDKPLVWFWDEKIPDHGLSILQGDPGVSKSYLSLFMAAHISTGTPWPDCPEIPVVEGFVLIFSGEDGEPRIKERCRWMGADMDRILLATTSRDALMDIRRDLEPLRAALDSLPFGKCRLVILDPVTAYLGDCRANSNTEVRAALGPLATLAVEYNLCVLAISHLNKRQGDKHVYRGLGSMGFTAIARSVWGVLWDESDENRETRIFCPVKTNYSKHATGLKYQIINNAIQFEIDPYYGNIDDVSGKAKDSQMSKAHEASEWLMELLENNDIAAPTIWEEAKKLGYTKDLIYRAKKLVPVRAYKTDFAKGGWMWSRTDIKESPE